MYGSSHWTFVSSFVILCRGVKMWSMWLSAGILCIGLKSMVECLRLLTLGRAGLQQIQCDVNYLRPVLKRFLQVCDCRPSTMRALIHSEVLFRRRFLATLQEHTHVAISLVQGPEGEGVSHLCDELLSAAVERAVDRVLLEPVLLERIVAAATHQQPHR